ncbi:hypothetical protein [Vibrio sp.]|uniref:hypothetical protein n=1 Tax=Vibrio sp. TaxID=678 RepID=UPI003D0C340B
MISTALAIVAIIIVSIGIARFLQVAKYEQIAKVAADRLELIHNAMQRAYMDSIQTGVAPNNINAYPASGSALVSGGYIDNCSAAQEAARQCLNVQKLPWVTTSNSDQTIQIQRFTDSADNFPAFRLSFSLAGLTPIKLRNIVRTKLSEYPNYTEDASANVTLTFKRPSAAVSLENLVKKDGSEPMTSDWDFGNFYLDNVRDISYSGLNDRTGLTGLMKLGSVFVPNSSGIVVSKPTCPTGYQANIQVFMAGSGGSNGNNLPYNIRSFAPWYVDQGGSWRVYYRVLGEDSVGNARFYYEGAVAYATWCDFS